MEERIERTWNRLLLGISRQPGFTLVTPSPQELGGSEEPAQDPEVEEDDEQPTTTVFKAVFDYPVTDEMLADAVGVQERFMQRRHTLSAEEPDEEQDPALQDPEVEEDDTDPETDPEAKHLAGPPETKHLSYPAERNAWTSTTP